MRLFRRTKVFLHSQMKLNPAAGKPASAALSQLRRLGQLRHSQQIAIERTSSLLAASRHGELHMIDCGKCDHKKLPNFQCSQRRPPRQPVRINISSLLMDSALLRNFAIIAHIDHGKSTLADRLLELTGSLTAREMQAQVLDSMDLDRERGITIKAHAVRMMYTAQDGQTYQLNLIDTPGHVDFSYEVSRALASCEGALLVVDASQGVEAQTLANSYLAINHGLEIIPVINKIDLPSADIPRTKEMIEGAVGLDASDAVLISAKTGQGVPDVLEAVVKRIPPPKGNPDNPLQALIFDSWFDPYRGVIVLTRVFQGTLRKGQKIRLMWNGKVLDVEALGVLTPKPVEINELRAGEVGFLIANIKNVADTKIGDTITEENNPAIEPLPGFEEIKPMVIFAGALHHRGARAHAITRGP